MSKDQFIRAHEQLINVAMDRNPKLSWDKAYDSTADAAYDRMKDNLADMADQLKEKKDGA